MTSDPTTVLVTSRSFSSGDLDARGRLEAAGVQVVLGPPDHDLDELRPLLAGSGAWIAGAAAVTASHLEAAPRLRLVARYGVGVDAVDLAAAAERGVLVTNTPGANSGAVADHTLALLLAALRQVTTGDRGVRRDDWQVQRARELGHLTVGIVGAGRIGRGVAARLSGFGSILLGHDPWVADDTLRAAGMQPASLREIAARCDVVSLHAPGEETIVDREWLRRVRPSLILVNTARAHLVDEDAVADALREGRLQVYATDTLSAESGSSSALLDGSLVDRTVFTPHSAAQTVEAVDLMSAGVVDAVLALLAGESPPNLVTPPTGPFRTGGSAAEDSRTDGSRTGDTQPGGSGPAVPKIGESPTTDRHTAHADTEET